MVFALPLSVVFRPAWRRALPALVTLMLLGGAGAHADSLCAATARQAPPPDAIRMAQIALREHAAWGGAQLDAHGRLTHAGAVEAGMRAGPVLAPAPWQRVMGYWSAVRAGTTAWPAQIHFGALRPAERHLLEQALAQASESRLAGLGVGPDQGLAGHELQAARVALARVAVIDTPWSAAFISWLAREAGLDASRFAFSEAHADYAAAAWAATQAEAAGTAWAQALRACDLQQTAPRVGDLVCHARGRSAGIDGYAALSQALQQRLDRDRSLPMHCDVVTRVDAVGLEAVGGNVLDAVTQRRLDFAPGTQHIDSSYLPDTCTEQALAAGTCTDRHMNRQPWSLLLQWR